MRFTMCGFQGAEDWTTGFLSIGPSGGVPPPQGRPCAANLTCSCASTPALAPARHALQPLWNVQGATQGGGGFGPNNS